MRTEGQVASKGLHPHAPSGGLCAKETAECEGFCLAIHTSRVTVPKSEEMRREPEDTSSPGA